MANRHSGRLNTSEASNPPDVLSRTGTSGMVAAYRRRDLRRGVRIELLTVAWMLVEAAVSIGAGVVAGSFLLMAFGLDSVIELVSGGMLLWRLTAETQASRILVVGNAGGAAGDRNAGTREWLQHVTRAERRAAWVVAVALAALCGFVLVSAMYGFVTRSQPERSAVGLAIAAAAVLVMPWLGIIKRHLAGRLGSGALRGDAAESFTCGYMAATVLVGLVLNALFHWWWAEDVAMLVFLVWLVSETREAFEEARAASDEGADAGVTPPAS